ncbi:protease Do-like 2, chloroplastic isoform X1 [Malus sylvestris]|uniref:protease Do-like 2, chloroplastic isoform X1 n=1 Tax=Malus sylvestris TaxID=3752 RepID=UPI0021ACFAD7|nr:protease Do-like 2, chloroplastic isoform X1 [Malus sylvestris]
MAVAVGNCCFSAVTSTVKLRSSVSVQPFFATWLCSGSYQYHALKPVGQSNRERASSSRKGSQSSSPPSADKYQSEREGVPNKFSGNERGKKGKSQSVVYRTFGTQRKERKESVVDQKEQQVEPKSLQDADFLNAVVKVYCTHTAPDYSLPWQKQRQYTSTGSAFMIGDGKLLTNAHCVEHYTQVKVKRRGDDTKFVAKVFTLKKINNILDIGMMLQLVESEEFWKGAEPLQLGSLPHLQEAVTVVGYPLGGDTISVTKGVVSRIEVTPYAHGSSDLLGIQIDAAINPGNSGGPAFNDQGECIGVAFQVYRSEEAENIGYVIPTTVVSHFLDDYERNGKYTGFPCLGVLLQKLENPALKACLKVESIVGVLVRRVEPTSDAHNVLKEGDVIVSFDDVHVGCEGTVPFRSNERIAFRYLISQKFAGDVADIGIIRAGEYMKVKAVLHPRVHLVPFHIDGGQPSYLIIAGLVFTPLSEPLIEEECDDSIGLKLLAKARYSLARFKGEQIVILSQVLANEVNIGYEDMSNQQVLKLNGIQIRNIHHLAYLVDSCKDKYLVFEFEDNYITVLEREAAAAASSCILKDYGIPSERSCDLLDPYADSLGDNQAVDQDIGDSPVSNLEIGFDGIIWA